MASSSGRQAPLPTVETNCVDAKPSVFLIDATPDIREQLDALRDVRPGPGDRVDRAPLDGVLLTHAHLGHYTGLSFFGFEAVHTHDLPVYCSPSMAGYLRDNGPWSQLVELENIELREVQQEEPFALGDDVFVTAITRSCQRSLAL